MLAEATAEKHVWLCSGQEVFPAMLAAIDAASERVRLEMYTFSPGTLAERFREAFLRARKRGARVQVLVDALGSYNLPAGFWTSLREAGGEVSLFNPLALGRLGIRNHRKLLVCDESVAFVGGFNIAPEYEGDGVTCGWCDVAVKLSGPLVAQLALSFDEMFDKADFQHKRFARLRRAGMSRAVLRGKEQLLLSGPGRGRNPIKSALKRDLARARSAWIMTAYFLPTWRIRRQLGRIARGGGQVDLLLAGKSDVVLAHLAARSLYRRFLRSGVRIFEYQPQVLHAKMVIIDNAVYLGSANLDQRSLNINYELMIRFEDPEMVRQAKAVFASNLKHCREITRETWRHKRSWWRRLKQRWAYFILVRVDPYIARWQWRGLPD